MAEGLAAASTTEARAGPTKQGGTVVGLTPHEREALRLPAAGKTDREIADALLVSRRTATSHSPSLYAKLRVSACAEAGGRAVRDGLV